MNDLFRSSYKRAHDRAIHQQPAVVEVLGSSMRLYRHGEQVAEEDITPQDWRVLRVVAHAPLGIYLAVAPHVDQPLPDEVAAELASYTQHIHRVERALQQVKLTPEDQTRQEQILDACKALLDIAQQQGRVSEAALQEFTRSMGPIVLKNAQVAARSQIDAMHATLRAWMDGLPAEDRASLTFVVRGDQQPRRGHVAVIYFASALGQTSTNCYPMEGGRVAYAEDLFGEKTSLDLLSTLAVDLKASKAFFGDEARLSTDILAEGAADYAASLLAADPIR